MTTFTQSVGALAIALTVSVVGPAAAAEVPGALKLGTALERAYPVESFAQYGYGRRGYYGRGYGGGYGRGYRRGGGYGGAVALGLGGLAAGALIGGAIASSEAQAGGTYPGAPVGNVYGYDPNWVSYCASKYRSFDPASGTYLARDGFRYACE